ncbi:MAG: hypothetical protein C4524_15390 [Candidatus Zixiibacteriota bacterium]|nr:MAG: hypothetical protein C4524_15390 [candidate division Zixibacteria bacterium]
MIMPEHKYYTMAQWRVKPGREDEFRRAWKDIGQALSNIRHTPIQGRLLQSTDNPREFHSFATWKSDEDLRAARNEPSVEKAIQRTRDFCEESHLDAFLMTETFYEEELAEVSAEET